MCYDRLYCPLHYFVPSINIFRCVRMCVFVFFVLIDHFHWFYLFDFVAGGLVIHVTAFEKKIYLIWFE